MPIITRRTLAALVPLALAACAADVSRDKVAIADLMRTMFDRPDARLNAAPIVVSGDYAVADWTQGDAGGRALLAHSDAGWRLVLCAGDALRSVDELVSLGVPATDAAALARDLSAAERREPPTRLAVMAAFVGVVRMDR